MMSLQKISKRLADELKSAGGALCDRLDSRNEGKASIVVCVGDDAVSDFDAVQLVRVGCCKHLVAKGGGGRPDMAQAGGPDASKAQDAIDAIKQACWLVFFQDLKR